MKLLAIEGNTQHLDGGAMFGNVPKSMWEKWATADRWNRIPLACRALLVQLDDGRNVLFEVGIGTFFEPKLKERFGVEPGGEHLLLENLKRVGVRENDVDVVVLSHLHFDHAGGLLPDYGVPPRLLFPKARYYLSKRHWDYAQNPHPREKASFISVLQKLLADCDRLTLIDQTTHPDLDFGVTFRFSDGHTIGLMLSQLELDSGPMIFVTDLVPGVSWVHLPITMGYDRFPELKVDEKQAFYHAVLDKNAKLFFTHDPKIACAELFRDEKGRFFAAPVNI